MKIVSSGKVLNSPKFYKKKKTRRRIKYSFFLLIIILGTSSFIYILRQERFLIAEVIISEKSIIDKEKIIQTTQNLLDGYYLWLIPRANMFIYPRRAIKQTLLENFPRLEVVDLKVDASHKLNVEIEEHIPFALYCAGVPTPSVTSNCYFLNEEGFIFALAPSFSGAVYFIFSTIVLIENPIGKRFVEIDEFNSLLDFMDKLTTLNIHPLVLGLDNEDYSLTLSNEGQILWKRHGNFNLIYSDLSAFLSDETIKTQSGFLDRILYLDLRTENKIRWKFKE